MRAPEETAKRKAIMQALRQEERDQIRLSLPISPELMRSLFDFVHEELSRVECDNRLTHTLAFLGHALPVDAVVKWLEDAGGFCDL